MLFDNLKKVLVRNQNIDHNHDLYINGIHICSSKYFSDSWYLDIINEGITCGYYRYDNNSNYIKKCISKKLPKTKEYYSLYKELYGKELKIG